MPAARVELLVFGLNRIVDRLGVERRIDVPQQGNDVRIRVADAKDLEVVLVDIDDVEFVFPQADLAQRTQLVARSLDERKGTVKVLVNVRSARGAHVRLPQAASAQSREFLQEVPVFEAFLVGPLQSR